LDLKWDAGKKNFSEEHVTSAQTEEMAMQPVAVPSVDTIETLMQTDPALLDLTLDQLRTLVIAHRTGSALRAAERLGRQQSSVQKQLDTLNRQFQHLCGESLVVKQGRGKQLLFTPTGQAAAGWSEKLFQDWAAGIQECRRRLGATVTVGTTEFTLDYLGKAWERVKDRLQAEEVELRVVHVRTRRFWEALDSKRVDLLCGGIATPRGDLEVAASYEFIEWHRGTLVLLTNLSRRDLPTPKVGFERLASLPLVVPAAGIITDFLRRWYGESYQSRLDIVALIDELHYGLALLRSHLTDGCMLVTQSVGQAVLKGQLPTASDLRILELGDDFQPPLELVSGVFARRGERSQYAATHPVNVLWDAFADAVESTVPEAAP
jgi:DNA-binding transcriptional LysR family regulator